MCCWSFLGKVIALMLAMIFVGAMCFSLWMVNIQLTAFEESTYEDIFSDRDVYENVVPLILPAIARSIELSEDETDLPGTVLFSQVVDNLDQEDWNQIAAEIFPPNYLQEQLNDNSEIFFNFANGDRSRLDVVFDTGTIRDNLTGQPGDRMMNRIFTSLETCDETREAQMVEFLEGALVEFPYCKPTDTGLQTQVFTVLSEAKDRLVSDIPDEWSIREQRSKREDIPVSEVDHLFVQEIQRPVVLTRALYPLAFLVPSAFLAMIVIVTVRSGKSFFAWMGWSVAAAGLLSLLPLGFIPLIMPGLYGSGSGDIDAFQAEALQGVVRTLIGEFSTPILIQGTALVIGGFIAVFISIVLPSDDDEADEINYPYQSMMMPQMQTFGSTPPQPPRPPAPPNVFSSNSAEESKTHTAPIDDDNFPTVSLPKSDESTPPP